jgi:type IV secretory pathway VirB3-like protein
MVDTREFAIKVHRSLLPRELLAGVPQAGLLLLFTMFVMFVLSFSMYYMIIPIALLYLVMRHLTKMDPWMIDMVRDNIQQKDVYIP